METDAERIFDTEENNAASVEEHSRFS